MDRCRCVGRTVFNVLKTSNGAVEIMSASNRKNGCLRCWRCKFLPLDIVHMIEMSQRIGYVCIMVTKQCLPQSRYPNV